MAVETLRGGTPRITLQPEEPSRYELLHRALSELGHPGRLEILTRLARRSASPKGITRRLHEELLG